MAGGDPGPSGVSYYVSMGDCLGPAAPPAFSGGHPELTGPVAVGTWESHTYHGPERCRCGPPDESYLDYHRSRGFPYRTLRCVSGRRPRFSGAGPTLRRCWRSYFPSGSSRHLRLLDGWGPAGCPPAWTPSGDRSGIDPVPAAGCHLRPPPPPRAPGRVYRQRRVRQAASLRRRAISPGQLAGSRQWHAAAAGRHPPEEGVPNRAGRPRAACRRRGSRTRHQVLRQTRGVHPQSGGQQTQIKGYASSRHSTVPG